MSDWIPIVIVLVGVQLILRGVIHLALRCRAGDEEEEELVTYEYLTLSTYWDDMANLLNKAAGEGWEVDEVWAPDEEDNDPAYRILLRKEK